MKATAVTMGKRKLVGGRKIKKRFGKEENNLR